MESETSHGSILYSNHLIMSLGYRLLVICAYKVLTVGYLFVCLSAVHCVSRRLLQIHSSLIGDENFHQPGNGI